MKRRRVREKIECKAKGCGATFNSDYRLKHNRKQHGGECVPYQVAGVPKNPFEAAKRRHVLNTGNPEPRCCSEGGEVISEIEESFSENQSGATGDTLSHQTESEVISKSTFDCDKYAGNPEPRSCSEGGEDVSEIVESFSENQSGATESEMSKSTFECDSESDGGSYTSSTSSEVVNNEDERDNVDMMWINCAGKLQHMMHSLNETGQSVLGEIKKASVPNIEQFAVSVVDLAESVASQSYELKKCAKRCLEEIKKDKARGSIQSEQEIPPLMEHDPAKRDEISADTQREFLINIGPYQPKLAAYPSNDSIPSGKQNRFSSQWYKEYPHLEYSVQKDAAFCFVCCLFPEGVGRPSADKSWTVNGVRQWHKMKSVGTKKKGKLPQHFTSQAHQEALGQFARFMNPNQRIEALLDSCRRQELIKEADDAAFNTRVVTILCDIVRTLAIQDIAFRGETDEASNFSQIVQLMSRQCSLLKCWQNEQRMRPYHITYMSGCSQNEFIKLIGDAVRHQILKELEEAPAFSVMADTTPDTSNKDQLSIIVRYVNAENKPVERLLSLTVLEKKTGDGHASEILGSLNNHSVDVGKLYFQSYDFAACMSGEYNGCQKNLNDKIKKDFPEKEVPYIPCQAHRLNTFVERSCKASCIISSMFMVLQSLYTFFSSSTKRSEALSKAQEDIEGSLKLRNLSQTRWIARSESIESVWISFESIVSLLQKVTSNEMESDTKTRDQAKSLLTNTTKFDFIFSLATMRFIMRHCKVLVVQLQEEGLNLLDALTLVRTTTTALEKIQNEADVYNQVKAAAAMARKVGCEPEQEFNRHHRRRVRPRRFDEMSESEADVDFASFYRKETFSVLDQIIADCRENWNLVFTTIQPFSVLMPPWEKVSEELVERLCKLLGGNITSGNLVGELSVLREEIVGGKPLKTKSVREVAAFVSTKKLVYPTCNLALTFLQTAPVTVASNERSLSKLKVVKNKLRSTMLQDRLESLMLISCEREFSNDLDLNEIVKNWVNLKKRRV